MEGGGFLGVLNSDTHRRRGGGGGGGGGGGKWLVVAVTNFIFRLAEPQNLICRDKIFLS